MSKRGVELGDAVLVIERRGEQQIVRNGLVIALTMRAGLLGPKGETAIQTAFVMENLMYDRVYLAGDVIHVTHRDWIEGRAQLAYEELMYPPSGVCQFCRCTELRACAGGCGWLDLERTICSAPACWAKLKETGDARDE